MKKLRQYDATRGFRIASFLGLVATNATIDHLRARQAESTPLDDVIEDYASLRAEAPRDVVEARQEAELARAALAQLSGDERAFVVDCFRDERSPEELARALGVTTNTVYSRKFKIREKLQKIVRTLDGARRGVSVASASTSQRKASVARRQSGDCQRRKLTKLSSRDACFSTVNPSARTIWKLRDTHGASVPGWPSGPVMRASRATRRRVPSGEKPASST